MSLWLLLRIASSPLSHGSPANAASSNDPSRSNTYDSASIPFSSSMSSTTSSLSQYSLYQPQQISPNLPGTAAAFASAPASVVGSSSLPERESSLPVSPNPNTFTQPSDERTPQAPSNPQLTKIAHSERERDLRRISAESARSNDTYSATSRMGALSFEPEAPTTAAAAAGWSTGGGGGKGSVPIASLSSAMSSSSSQQARPGIGKPGGTPLFDLSSASQFDGPPALDVIDLSTSPQSFQQQHQKQGSNVFPASTNLAGLAQSPSRAAGLAASPNVNNPSTAAASTMDYLSTPAASGNQSPMVESGGVGTGLGIGMPQGEMTMGSGPPRTPAGGVQMTFDEGLLRTLCDLDVSGCLSWRGGSYRC